MAVALVECVEASFPVERPPLPCQLPRQLPNYSIFVFRILLEALSNEVVHKVLSQCEKECAVTAKLETGSSSWRSLEPFFLVSSRLPSLTISFVTSASIDF